MPVQIGQQLKEWWLVEGGSRAPTPNWDIASTCTISGRDGLLLVEAKAHVGEQSPLDKCGAESLKNREPIKRAIMEANAGLREVAGGSWQLSAQHHYQIANRLAWSWKLARLGVPVVLIYPGFLDAVELSYGRTPFRSKTDWKNALLEYCRDVIDSSCWEGTLDVGGATILPLMRTRVQPIKQQ